ncbi:MAG: hypothetical protein V1740_02735 [Candidatus Woesearchaeota archaeon]
MFKLLCPKCKNSMNYQSTTKILTGKRKRCVYCGHSFATKDHILKIL